MAGNIFISIKEWKKPLSRNKYKILAALALVVLGMVLQGYASKYADLKDGTVSSDLLLDTFSPINLSFIFVWLFLLNWAVYFGYSILCDSERMHFYFGAFGILGIIRASFIVLTHLGIHTDAVIPHYPGFLDKAFFSNDLFFSGHTAYPFLGFLVFRNNWMKISMLFFTLILASSVILMHLHYSIDVFAAFFITYVVYIWGKKLFLKEEKS